MMGQKLTPLQEEYLSQIEIISPITKRNPRYHIAKELEKKGLLKLIESGTPLIGISLTNAGKEHLSDRYEILIRIEREDLFVKNQYRIYELNKMKGARITIVNKDTGAIIRETK